MRELYQNIKVKKELRSSLIGLKALIKTEVGRQQLLAISKKNLDPVMYCLAESDPKVRKNAAIILGKIKWQPATEVLLDAYEAEETQFVRPEYIHALSKLKIIPYLPFFEARLQQLLKEETVQETQKHIQAEIDALEELLLINGKNRHEFQGYHQPFDCYVKMLPAFVAPSEKIVTSKHKALKNGIRILTDSIEDLYEIRCIQEVLCLTSQKKRVAFQPEIIADAILTSDFTEQLQQAHSGKGPFAFRIGITGGILEGKEKTEFIQNLAKRLVEGSGRCLINSSSHYQVEIRLEVNSDSQCQIFYKLFTLPDHRFEYRKECLSTDMQPEIAAGLVSLAKPYLKAHAQVLDPFCGTGNLLIERSFAIPTRSSYGIDTYADAIRIARAASSVTGMNHNYIHRDFFDFHHEYLFDEIWADFPRMEKDRTKMDQWYGRFFDKIEELLSQKSRLFLYTCESNLIKKQLRLHPYYRILLETSVSAKGKTVFFILERD